MRHEPENAPKKTIMAFLREMVQHGTMPHKAQLRPLVAEHCVWLRPDSSGNVGGCRATSERDVHPKPSLMHCDTRIASRLCRPSPRAVLAALTAVELHIAV